MAINITGICDRCGEPVNLSEDEIQDVIQGVSRDALFILDPLDVPTIMYIDLCPRCDGVLKRITEEAGPIRGMRPTQDGPPAKDDPAGAGAGEGGE
jgi:hypothetical protein